MTSRDNLTEFGNAIETEIDAGSSVMAFHGLGVEDIILCRLKSRRCVSRFGIVHIFDRSKNGKGLTSKHHRRIDY
jgi:hypothetical protein